VTEAALELDSLRLLASVFAGRTVDVAATGPGERSWTDGVTLYVEPASAATVTEVLAVQGSLLAAGSLDTEIVAQLARRPALARRYLAVEGHRALAANGAVLPPRLRHLVDLDLAARVGGPSASLELARSRAPLADAPPSFGTIEVRRLLAASARAATSSNDPVAAAAGTTTTTTTSEQRPPPTLDDDDDAEDLGKLLSSPVGRGGALGRVFRRLLSPARARGQAGPAGADAPTHVSRARPGIGARVVSSTPSSALPEELDVASAGARYPEWDVHRRRYRPDWCAVVEADPPARTAETLELGGVLVFRRQLARLGIGFTRCRRQRQGDDIDLDAAIEAQIDARAGSPHDDCYVDSVRRRRDLSVLVLLDVSGSAAEPGTGGRAVHAHQRETALALTAALHELGDRVALYGFNSRGRQHVQLLRVKAFADGLDHGVTTRLAQLTPGAYTRVGAAIRHGTTILEMRAGTPRRLLVVLSDGFAYDHGYEGRYGEADARRALVEARRRGVGCLCLSVGADRDPEALRRVFGAAALAAVSRTEQLAPLVGPLFRSALRSAEAQRRRFQRTERTRERLVLEGEDQ
jgi:hypothetical protein